MTTRQTELPGVGTKHTIELATGEKLVIVDHRIGHFELARVDADGHTTPLAKLQPREAAELGRILGRGEVVEEDPRKAMLLEQFGLEWVRLEAGSPLCGTTLGASDIRARSGASVIAVLRADGSSLTSPPPETEFREGDTLVLVGRPEQIEAFLERFTHRAP